MTENERLTFKTELGISIDKNEDCPTMSICWNCDIPPRKCNYFNDAIEKLAEYEAVGTVEELQELKENHIRCEDCAGCTSWKCDCANVRDYAIREFAERLNKRLHCAFSDDLEIQKYVDEIAEGMRGEEC